MDFFAQPLLMLLLWYTPTACSALEEPPPLAALPSGSETRGSPDVPLPSLEPVREVLGDCGVPLILTEFLPDPTRVPDGSGEYLEVFNPRAEPVCINGWRLTDLRRDSHIITAPDRVVVPPHSAIVLGLEADPRLNGGLALGYRYDGFHLSNQSDRVRVEDACGNVVFDHVYPTDPGFPAMKPGRSVELLKLSSDGRQAGSWQLAKQRLKSGDRGTPGVTVLDKGTPGRAVPAEAKTASTRPKRGQKPVVE